MNLFILNKTNSKFYYKPDTTFCKESDDFYIPGNVHSLKIQPGIAVRIVKSGKYISSKFADRYYRSISFAANIFHSNLLNPSIQIEDLAHFSSLERSLYLIDKQIDISDLIRYKNLSLYNDSKTIEMNLGKDMNYVLNMAVEKISSVFSLKSGDSIIVVEDSSTEIKRGDIIKLTIGDSNENYVKLLDFSIK